MVQQEQVEQAAGIVAAYVAHNSVPAAELPRLIATVHAALAGLGQEPTLAATATSKLTSAQIRRSITADALVSFEDGKPYRTLRRHLTTRGLTPEAYRAKWGLPSDYPMVAASYSQQRSTLAQSLGLGRMRRRPAAAPEAATGDVGTEAQDSATEREGRRRARGAAA
jgi:predicted transcriptional regulator